LRPVTHFSVGLLSLGIMAASAQADVGVLDKYECHNHLQTGDYHCHGPADMAKLGGVILSADARTQVWSTSADELYLFAGIAANAEYNHKWMAVNASYFLMPLVTNADDLSTSDTVSQQGWEAGVKVGPGVGRKGSKVYALAGWSSADITDSGDSSNDSELSGYYIGLGFGTNSNTLTLDVAATYRDAASIETYFKDVLVEPVDVTAFDVRMAVGWRF